MTEKQSKTKNRLIAGIFTAAGIALCSYITSPVTFYLYSKTESRTVREYVEKHVDDLIEEQEDGLGIQYPGRPTFHYRLPEQNMSILDGFGEGQVGWYNQDEDAIYLRSGIMRTPEGGIDELLVHISTWGKTVEAKTVLSHELVHYYTDKRGQELLGKDWVPSDEELNNHLRNKAEVMAFLAICEGIAVYVQRKVHPDSNFSEKGRKYEVGFDFVKPIINQFGSKGIDYLIVNTPTAEELQSPETYWKRAEMILSRN
ncbi:hypothetical protein HY495_04135 [Candidatus Woesearchaeota archaeon]|nr:hypothetical protein [Candidatus Woesearchaeota archaeon]